MADGVFPCQGTLVVAVGDSLHGYYARGNSGTVVDCEGMHPIVLWNHDPFNPRESNSAKLRKAAPPSLPPIDNNAIGGGNAHNNSPVLHVSGKTQLDGILGCV